MCPQEKAFLKLVLWSFPRPSIYPFVKAKTCFHIRSKHKKVKQNYKENSKLTVLTLKPEVRQIKTNG